MPQRVLRRGHLRPSANGRFGSGVWVSGSGAVLPAQEPRPSLRAPRETVFIACGRTSSHGDTSYVPVCAAPPPGSGSLRGLAAETPESGPGIVYVVALQAFASASRPPGSTPRLLTSAGTARVFAFGSGPPLARSSTILLDSATPVVAALGGAGSVADLSRTILRGASHGVGLRQLPNPFRGPSLSSRY